MISNFYHMSVWLFITITGKTVFINIDECSGKILTRTKGGSISNVQHTGIYLGRNTYFNEHYVLHNHIKVGRAYISTYQEYCDGTNAYWQNETCVNDRYTVISKGLEMIIEGQSYDLISNNCQVYTNRACHNSSHSQDVNKWAGGILLGLTVLGLASAIFSSD